MVAIYKALLGLAAAPLVAGHFACHAAATNKRGLHPDHPTPLSEPHTQSYGLTHTTARFPYTSQVTLDNVTYTTTLTSTRNDFWVYTTYGAGPTKSMETSWGRAAPTPMTTAPAAIGAWMTAEQKRSVVSSASHSRASVILVPDERKCVDCVERARSMGGPYVINEDKEKCCVNGEKCDLPDGLQCLAAMEYATLNKCGSNQ